MLSQYSWWDLIKVVLVVLIVYYAYVIWAYYRDDIREWIGSRRHKDDSTVKEADEPEEDNSSLYEVLNYAPVTSVDQPIALKPAVIAESTNRSSPAVGNNDVDLNGLSIDQDLPESNGFSLPLPLERERAGEQPLGELIDAAQRIQTDPEGVLTPNDPTDTTAANLADVINQQQGRSALAGINFNR